MCDAKMQRWEYEVSEARALESVRLKLKRDVGSERMTQHNTTRFVDCKFC
jgi:hypothetical protein